MKEHLACRRGPLEKIKGNESKLGNRDKLRKELIRNFSPIGKDPIED